MTPTPDAASGSSDRDIVIHRHIAAPPARVWQAWTDPEQLVQWFGPDGMDLPEGMITTTTFEDVPGEPTMSRLSIRITHPTADDRRKHEDMGVIEGWNSSLDCLEDLLAAKS